MRGNQSVLHATTRNEEDKVMAGGTPANPATLVQLRVLKSRMPFAQYVPVGPAVSRS